MPLVRIRRKPFLYNIYSLPKLHAIRRAYVDIKMRVQNSSNISKRN